MLVTILRDRGRITALSILNHTERRSADTFPQINRCVIDRLFIATYTGFDRIVPRISIFMDERALLGVISIDVRANK